MALQGTTDGFMIVSAFERTMSILSDSLPDRMLLCACLGELKNFDVIMREVKVRGIDNAIFDTLEQVTQVKPHHSAVSRRRHVFTKILLRAVMQVLLQHSWHTHLDVGQSDFAFTSSLIMSRQLTWLQVISGYDWRVPGNHPHMQQLVCKEMPLCNCRYQYLGMRSSVLPLQPC